VSQSQEILKLNDDLKQQTNEAQLFKDKSSTLKTEITQLQLQLKTTQTQHSADLHAFEQHIKTQKALEEQLSSLNNEVACLLKEQEQYKSTVTHLQQIIQSSADAQKNYEKMLKHTKNISFSRLARMAPILLQIQGIENKADELEERGEKEACKEARLLAARLRGDIKKYSKNKEHNEATALNHFKLQAAQHISLSKIVLGSHRETWKYILANITLGVFLVGVGYAAAVLINKQVTGNYMFFNKTASVKQVEQLEERISLINHNS
jgi:effector protein B